MRKMPIAFPKTDVNRLFGEAKTRMTFPLGVPGLFKNDRETSLRRASEWKPYRALTDAWRVSAGRFNVWSEPFYMRYKVGAVLWVKERPRQAAKTCRFIIRIVDAKIVRLWDLTNTEILERRAIRSSGVSSWLTVLSPSGMS